VAVRAEDVTIGPDAGAAACRMSGVLEEVTYRGTVLDYTLRMPDGQRIVATMTRRVDIATGAVVPIRVEVANVIPLED